MIEPRPYFAPLTGTEPKRHDEQAASRVAAAAEMERDRALFGRLNVERPQVSEIKITNLPDDFGSKIAEFDQEIFGRGVPIDREGLVSLGRTRFDEMIAAERKVKPRGSRTDATSFNAVQGVLGAFVASSVPPRKMMEQASGSGRERDEVRKISGFDDLWKATQERREDIDDIYEFRDRFESLCFGHSMLGRLSKDSHLRSHFFAGGRGRKVELFRDWWSVLNGTFTSVTLVEPIWHIVAWLADARISPPPSLTDLARDFFNVRSPSKAQLETAKAVLNGFLLDLDDWALWNYVGNRTRTAVDQGRLASWRRDDLRKRFPVVASFLADVRAGFYSDVGFGVESYRQFQPARHRAFLDTIVRQFSTQLSAVTALAIEKSFPGSVVARFRREILCKGKVSQRAEITAHLAAAFPGASFQLEFEEVKS